MSEALATIKISCCHVHVQWYPESESKGNSSACSTLIHIPCQPIRTVEPITPDPFPAHTSAQSRARFRSTTWTTLVCRVSIPVGLPSHKAAIVLQCIVERGLVQALTVFPAGQRRFGATASIRKTSAEIGGIPEWDRSGPGPAQVEPHAAGRARHARSGKFPKGVACPPSASPNSSRLSPTTRLPHEPVGHFQIKPAGPSVVTGIRPDFGKRRIDRRDIAAMTIEKGRTGETLEPPANRRYPAPRQAAWKVSD